MTTPEHDVRLKTPGGSLKRLRMKLFLAWLLSSCVALFLACTALDACASAGQESNAGKAKADAADVKEGTLYAVILGVATHHSPLIPRLPSRAKDAEALAQSLSCDQKLFRNVRVKLLVNGSATVQAVECALKDSTENDSILVFLSGYVAEAPAAQGKWFFVTYDSDPANLEGTALNMEKLASILHGRGKRSAMILDVCQGIRAPEREGGGGQASLAKELLRALDKFNGTVVISATRAEGTGQEASERGKQRFAPYLVKALKGQPRGDCQRVVTLGDAVAYTCEQRRAKGNRDEAPELEARLVGAFPLSLSAGTESRLTPKGGLPSSVESLPPETLTGVQGVKSKRLEQPK